MSADRVKIAVAGSLAILFGLALALRQVVPSHALTPAVATILFITGTSIGLIGIWLRDRPKGASCLNAAGLLVYVGVVVSILIDPDQLVRLAAEAGQTE